MVGIENLKFKRKIFIMSCYPPPNDARFVIHLINALNLVDFNNYHSVVFMGDFNFPNILTRLMGLVFHTVLQMTEIGWWIS